MIPTDWMPHHRDADSELVGYLVPVGDAGYVCVPVTVFGYALAEAADVAAGEAVLEAVGLSYLADRWRLTLEDGRSIAVLLAEASPDRLVVMNVDYADGGDAGHRFVLEVPTDRLARA